MSLEVAAKVVVSECKELESVRQVLSFFGGEAVFSGFEAGPSLREVQRLDAVKGRLIRSEHKLVRIALRSPHIRPIVMCEERQKREKSLFALSENVAKSELFS